MKKYIKYCLACLLLVLAVCGIAGCGEESAPVPVDENEKGYVIYYLNSAGNKLVETSYRPQATDTDGLIQELMSNLSVVPVDLEYQPAIPGTVEKLGYRLDANVLHVYADANYVLMNAIEEIFCRAALTKTLTQIPGIDYVTIYCAEQPIVDAAGNPVGLLSAADFVDSVRDVNSFEKTSMTLYFASETGDTLVTETREVMRSSNTSVEKLIVEQLIEGPKLAGRYPTLPQDVKLLSVSVNDSICSINLDAAFLNSTLEINEYLPIYSIVNSLSELSTVSRVQIRINGSEDAVFRDRVPLNTLFERNYDYISGGKTN